MAQEVELLLFVVALAIALIPRLRDFRPYRWEIDYANYY